MVEKNATPKPTVGTWDKIDGTDTPRKPKITFIFEKPEVVIMQCDKPKEIIWEDGVFYTFDCLHNGKEEVVLTSAWSLLRGLKMFEPLNGKTLKITRTMEKGKQLFKVTENTEKV